MPDGSLFGQRARLVLGVPRVKVRLLREADRLDRRRWTFMCLLKAGAQLASARVDVAAPLRPFLVQRRVDAHDLPHRALPGLHFGPSREADTKPLGEVMLQ